MPFPEIDPIALQLGPLAIRWYALAYLAGLLLGWGLIRRLTDTSPSGASRAHIDDFLVWATLGVVLGGRLGYVIFYNPGHYLANPVDILKVWEGGMAFHGGLGGVMVAAALFARKYRISLLALGDLLAMAAPIGLFFGRIANFINGELFGRIAPDLPWGVIFPYGGPLPRHPSQLYEAVLEGLLLGLILLALWGLTRLRFRPGVLAGVFFAGYGVARFTVEAFREPDAHIGFLMGGATMGQLLSVPMIAGGVILLVWAARRPAVAMPERPQ